MAMKEWFRKMQPIQLYTILALTITFFITELIVSHLTHALTLLMDSYHMLCNIITLIGCIITIKYGKGSEIDDCAMKKSQSIQSSIGEELTSNPTGCHDKKNPKSSPSQNNQEKKLKNTFGWARIDVISMLICCVFLASLCFSIFVEALQTLVHIDHHDEMHHPIWVLCIGAAGLLLNGVCYLLIGGYTFHQGSFLYVTESGDVVLNKVVVNKSLQRGERRLSRTKSIHSTVTHPKQRQGLWEMTRDTCGCILVIICALLIFFTDKEVAKYIDPVISLVSVTFIMVLSYPYMKESCLILLQTIPDTIQIDSFKAELLKHFPDIINIHDFHVWQLTTHKVISTVHIIFQNPKVYIKVMDDIKEFFIENGITQVTIQPEFFKTTTSTTSLNSNKFVSNCLMACLRESCEQSHCCPGYETKALLKATSRDILPHNSIMDLASEEIIDNKFDDVTYGTSCNSGNTLKDDENIDLRKETVEKDTNSENNPAGIITVLSKDISEVLPKINLHNETGTDSNNEPAVVEMQLDVMKSVEASNLFDATTVEKETASYPNNDTTDVVTEIQSGGINSNVHDGQDTTK